MNQKQFLQLGGSLITTIAILGFTGLIGPTPEQSIFARTWWFDNNENWAHLIIGIVALISSFILKSDSQKSLVLAIGVLALIVGIYGIFNNQLLGANLETPADDIFYITLGTWAIWTSFRKKNGW
jgi:hypothetical protein